MSDTYLETNQAHWDARVDAHWASAFYDVPGWLAGRDSLTPPDLAMLPDDLEGRRLLHLQCHFGQDTLSLARRGAVVTGADLSSRAIERARELAGLAKLEATFVESDVYGLPDRLEGAFDVVYTSWGVIGWLPDLHRWAEVVAHFLAPGGVFVLAEFHPMLWMFGEDRGKFTYSYFDRGPIVDEVSASYTGDATETTREVGWNHALSEVLGALLAHGLTLEAFEEYDYSPYACFSDMVEVAPGRHQWRGFEGVLPMGFAVRARRAQR